MAARKKKKQKAKTKRKNNRKKAKRKTKPRSVKEPVEIDESENDLEDEDEDEEEEEVEVVPFPNRPSFTSDEDDYEIEYVDEPEQQTDFQRPKDVFLEVAKPRVDNGDVIKFEIQKNGSLIGVEMWPFDWEKVQAKYGSGLYRVVSRSLSSGQYVGSQTQAIGDPSEFTPQVNNNDEYETEENPQPQPSALNSEVLTLLSLLERQSEKGKVEAREGSQAQSGMVNTMMTSMMGMMQTSSSDSQKMFMEMTKNTNRILDKMNETQMKMFENIQSQITQMSSKESPKPEFGTLDLLNMMRDSEDRGRQAFKDVVDLADAKADEKFEALGGSDEESGGKRSLSDKMIEAILPVMAGQIVKAQSQPQAPQIPQHPQMRNPQGLPPNSFVRAPAPPGQAPAKVLRPNPNKGAAPEEGAGFPNRKLPGAGGSQQTKTPFNQGGNQSAPQKTKGPQVPEASWEGQPDSRKSSPTLTPKAEKKEYGLPTVSFDEPVKEFTHAEHIDSLERQGETDLWEDEANSERVEKSEFDQVGKQLTPEEVDQLGFNQPNGKGNGQSQTEVQPVGMGDKMKKFQIGAKIGPWILEALNTKVNPQVAAQAHLNLFAENQISKEEVLRLFGVQATIELAKNFVNPLTERHVAWFKEYYAYLQTPTRTTSGQSPTSYTGKTS